jgi:hypothetical protein
VEEVLRGLLETPMVCFEFRTVIKDVDAESSRVTK